ncbi:hypothetical protein MMC26_004495 [Xylographa opegraphella]|nr:hypothetical protein [Xylographa opegraphella]
MAPITTDYAEIQRNEIEALRSIFMEDFMEQKAKAGAWNKTADRECRLKIRPHTKNDDDAYALVTFSLPATYPKTLPHCNVVYGTAIPVKVRNEIDEIVRNKPKTLLGSEMIYDLATSIGEILEEAVLAQVQTQEVPALDRERALHEAATHEREQQAKQARLQQQQDASEEEQRMLSRMVEKEQARLAKLQLKTPDPNASFEPAQQVAGGLTFDQEIRARDPEGTFTVFRVVHNKVRYRRGPLTEVFTVQPTGTSESSSPFLVLKECTVNAWKSEEKLKRAIQSLEADLETLIQLPVHPSIAKPLSFRLQRLSDGTYSTQGGWRISILMDFARRGSIRDVLETVGTIDIKNVRQWAIQLIEGLDFYHRHQIVHAGIRPENVLLEQSDTGPATVKLADGLFQNDLHLMKDESDIKFSTATSAYWTAPETFNSPQGQSASSRDVWDLGVLMLQMIFGLDIQRSYASPSALMDTLGLCRSFEDLLDRIFKADPRKRPSPFDLLPNEFLRSDDPVLEPPSASVMSRMTSATSMTPSKQIRPRHDSTNVLTSSSRYIKDFVESGRLGKGGFGEVVRARNKLDGRWYAIKKIIQTSTSALSGVLSEIILLSSMNHPNVVRYYTAWIEEERADDTAIVATTSDDSASSSGPEPGASMINFGHSASGLDFISSSGYPKIEFAYDNDDDDHNSMAIAEDSDNAATDDDTDDDDDDDDVNQLYSTNEALGAASASQRRRRSSAQVSYKTTLYIQMEYCEKQTLRDLIRNDLHNNVDECWRLFRQILEGLAHVHSHGIIHRDLKPDNVFIDSSNNVRLGDFGLARPGDYQAPSKYMSSVIANPSMTRSIGTSFYVAPEVRSSGGGHYNEKADMYSLGIILFEMCYPLKTSMERAELLGKLREVGCSLPATFEESDMAIQGEIIHSLVKHKASERPSSLELLRSGKVPLQVEDEIIRTAIQGISDTKSPYYTKLLDALFSSRKGEESSAKDLTYDMAVDPNLSSDDLLLQKMVKEKLTEIFRRHGAVETQRPLLLPNSRFYSNAAARLLDANGTLVQLPYDLTLPNARTLAKQPLTVRKTYAFGDVYRAGLPGSHPKSHREVDFDIASHDNFDLAIREAEVIKVIDEVIEVFPSLDSENMCYHIGHSRLLDCVLAFCDIAEEKWDVVKESLSKLNIGQWTWAKIRNELRAPGLAVPSTSLDELQKFDFRDIYDKAIPKLRLLLASTEDLESTFSHLEAVVTYLARFNVKGKVYINPLSSLNDKFYRGNILFQCIFNTKTRSVLAAGGRYDQLIQQHRPNQQIEDRHAVGFNLGWDRLFASMIRLQGNAIKSYVRKGDDESVKSWTPHRCDVLIDSADSSVLRTTGIKIVQTLWANGISAELAIDIGGSPSNSSLQNKDKAGPHGWIVQLKQDDTVRIQSLVQKEAIEMRTSELVSYVRGEIRERDRLEGAKTDRRALLRHSSSHQDPGGNSADREPDVRVLMALNRSKKSNRRSIVEDALLRSQELVQGFLDGPIAAVEIKDDTFEGLRDTRLSDPESWRRLIQNAPLAERQYLGNLHELLTNMSNEAKGSLRNAFVYNFRTKACIYYDLWRS